MLAGPWGRLRQIQWEYARKPGDLRFFFKFGAGARDTYVPPRYAALLGCSTGHWGRDANTGSHPRNHATGHANFARSGCPRPEWPDASHALDGGYRCGWAACGWNNCHERSREAAGRFRAGRPGTRDHHHGPRTWRSLLSAVYMGDQAHLGSRSDGAPVRAVTGTTPDFSVSIAPATLSLKQGQSGSAVVSVTPINAASLDGTDVRHYLLLRPARTKALALLRRRISKFPSGQRPPINSSLVLSTQAASQAKAEPVLKRESRAIAWAVLLPGTLILGGFAFGARRRRFLSRMVLLALLAFVTVLGTAACSPLYNYYNHGPPQNLPTPAGTFTVRIAAQSSNGVTATTHTTTIGLTVTQ